MLVESLSSHLTNSTSPKSLYDTKLASFAMSGYDVTAARGFLRKNNIRYLFSPKSAALGKDAFLNKTYCSVSYRDLGVEYPAAFFGKNGVEFYRINVPNT